MRDCYQVLLHRTATDAEVASQIAVLHAQGRAGMASGMLGSSEFRADLFGGYYDDLLHRPSRPGEAAGWASSGFDAAAVRAKFETSAEFMGNG